MASKDIINFSKETLPESGPGEIAKVEVAVAGVVAADIVLVTFQNTRPVTSTGDSFNVYATIGPTGASGKVTIRANRPQTPAVGVDLLVMEK